MELVFLDVNCNQLSINRNSIYYNKKDFNYLFRGRHLYLHDFSQSTRLYKNVSSTYYASEQNSSAEVLFFTFDGKYIRAQFFTGKNKKKSNFRFNLQI